MSLLTVKMMLAFMKERVPQYANAVVNISGGSANKAGFIDGTVLEITRLQGSHIARLVIYSRQN